jgi:hypothetical protein
MPRNIILLDDGGRPCSRESGRRCENPGGLDRERRVQEDAMSALSEGHSKLMSCGRALLGALTLAALWPVEATAQNVQGSCVVNRATFRAQTSGGGSTSSTAFVNIPQAALDVAVGGANPTCVIVVFTAQTQTTANENMLVRGQIPGIGVGVPAEFAMGPGTGTTEARPAQFVFENVPPGDYSVRMQFRSVVAGTTVTITRPTVIVHHR